MFQTTGKAIWSAYENLSLKVKQYRQSYEGEGDPLFGWVTEPSSPTYQTLEGQDSWLGEDAGHLHAEDTRDELEQRSAADAVDLAEEAQPLPPESLRPGTYTPETSEPSSILSERDLRALADAVPIRHKWRYWRLLYSSGRNGISLTTLYRYALDFPRSSTCHDWSIPYAFDLDGQPWHLHQGWNSFIESVLS